MKIKYDYLGYLILFVIISVNCVAADVGLGGVATNILEPVTLFGNFVDSACFILGGAFIFASLIKYIEHKRSPLMVPISTVVFLIIAGLILIALPFLSLFVDTGGVRFSLFG